MINTLKIQSPMEASARRKRLRYRSWHRGCKETDLVLGRFADARLGDLEPQLLDIYERLLDESDTDIWNWLTGQEAPMDYIALLSMMRSSDGSMIR